MVKNLLTMVVFICLCSGVYFTQTKIDYYSAKAGKFYTEKNLLITLPTNMVKSMTLGFDNLIADVIWLEFIQYFGENNIIKRSQGKGYDFSYTYKYIDVITTLDPNFDYAYWFGAFAIADEMNRPDLAIDLLNKGIKNNPTNWWLPYTAGIMELMYNGDFVRASNYINIAAQMKPNYPKIQRVQNVLDAKSLKVEKARDIWLVIYKDARSQGDKITMDRAKRKLKKLGYTIVE